jgi:hypothetical protein
LIEELVAEKILKFLIYFNLFSYPLTRQEIASYLGISHDNDKEFDNALRALLQVGTIHFSKGFYHIDPDDSIIKRRLKGNELARKRMKTARRYARIIARFPYVRGVFLSGSISKGYMAEEDDIDYFIITSPGRVWFTRTLLTLFKKIFLFNSYRNFCINYFIDSEHLLRQERHLYCATELVFLTPVYNPALYHDLLLANNWVKNYYPSFKKSGEYLVTPTTWFRSLLEQLFDNQFGSWLEEKLFQKSKKIILKKYKSLGNQAFDQSFSLNRHEIRYFPHHTTLKIMERYREQLSIILGKNQYPLSA